LSLVPLHRRSPGGATLVLGLLLGSAGGCTAWHAQPGPVPRVAAASRGDRLRIVRNDDRVVEIADARLVGDSIVGSGGTPPGRIAIAVADVRRVEARRPDALLTTALVVGVVVASIPLAYIAFVRPIFSDPNY
jgi:hypothetical protein